MARRALKGPETPALKAARLGPDPKLEKALGGVASAFARWKPASQVLVNVDAVPTDFPQINRTTRVNGWPIACVAVVHGPSNEGKTGLTIGLEGSFLARGNFVGHIDAEFTTPIGWVEQLIGSYARSNGYVALRPRTYEEARDAVREFCDGIAEAREKREVDEKTTGIVVVDSIRKLVPKKLFDELLKAQTADDEETKGKGRFGKKPKGIDGAGGRAGQIKAMINAAWLDELVPMLGQTKTTAVIIARETEVESDNPFAGPQHKIGGGKALYYDSSLVVRVTRDQFLYESTEKGAPLIGERHAVEVHKTKISGREERWPTAYFHTSNGNLFPAGFDRTRDVLDLALMLDVVEVKKSWIAFDGHNLGNGMIATLKMLRERPTVLAKIEERIAAKVTEEKRVFQPSDS